MTTESYREIIQRQRLDSAMIDDENLSIFDLDILPAELPQLSNEEAE